MNGSKQERQNKILELISANEIETQEELCEMLIEAGFNVTQATISRDIRELKLIKTSRAIEYGRLKYAVFGNTENEILISGKLRRILKDGVVSIKCVQNIVVIKTLEGLAMGVAASVDALKEPDIIGTIAGDDTIFCVVSSNKRGNVLIKKLQSIIQAE